jgi:hypothetical protein
VVDFNGYDKIRLVLTTALKSASPIGEHVKITEASDFDLYGTLI